MFAELQRDAFMLVMKISVKRARRTNKTLNAESNP